MHKWKSEKKRAGGAAASIMWQLHEHRGGGATSTDARDGTVRVALSQRSIHERRVKEWQNYQRSHRSYDEQTVSRVFIDLCFGNAITSRLVIDLCEREMPQTTRRFRELLSGTCACAAGGQRVDLINAYVYHIDKHRHLACIGDPNMDEAPIDALRDERACTTQIERGDVVMLSGSPNNNKTNFAIVLQPDETSMMEYGVLGRVSEGIETLNILEQLPVNSSGRPLTRVYATLSGTLSGDRPTM